MGRERTGRLKEGLLAALLASLAASLLLSVPLAAQVFMTQEEALRQAFGASATIERKSAFLSEAQLERARTLAGEEARIEQSVVTYYVASAGGRPLGAAYFDAHRVRTLQEVLMVVVAPDGRIRSVEVLRFAEPPEYVAPGGWLEQFSGRPLDEKLSIKGSVAGITGATLTSRAVTSAARRVLALHQVIQP